MTKMNETVTKRYIVVTTAQGQPKYVSKSMTDAKDWIAKQKKTSHLSEIDPNSDFARLMNIRPDLLEPQVLEIRTMTDVQLFNLLLGVEVRL